MSILKVANYYQIKLAQSSNAAYRNLIELQGEINKLSSVPEQYDYDDPQFQELSSEIKPANDALNSLKSKVNSLVYQASTTGVSGSEVSFRLKKIHEVLDRLIGLNYNQKKMFKLKAIANRIEGIEINPSKKKDEEKIIDLSSPSTAGAMEDSSRPAKLTPELKAVVDEEIKKKWGPKYPEWKDPE